MKHVLYLILLLSLTSCKKDKAIARVDIYLLQSFTMGVNTATSPSTSSISNAVIGTKLVSNEDILSYSQTTNTFTLRNSVKESIKSFGPDKGFAVTVNDEPIYYGTFHPLYLSSLRFGIATIEPLMTEKELTINYILINGSVDLQLLDKRNNPSLLTALRVSRRLK